jgi:hypothetical protein
MATVTFKQNIDHYVVGDVRDLDKDELKRLEEYAKRWDIKGDYLVKGKQTITNEEAPRTEKKTLGGDTVDITDETKKGQAAGNTRKASKPAPVTTPEGDDGSETETDPAEELPVDNDDVVKDGDNDPEPANPDANDTEESDEGDDQSEGDGNPTTTTPEGSEGNAQTQGQGDTPKQATQAKGSAKK